MTPATKPQQADLRSLLDALEEFRKLDPEMPVQRICYLLWVATHQPNCKQSEVGDAIGIGTSARSRNKDMLTDYGSKALGLLKAEQSDEDRRDNILTVTSKGETVLNKVSLKLRG